MDFILKMLKERLVVRCLLIRIPIGTWEYMWKDIAKGELHLGGNGIFYNNIFSWVFKILEQKIFYSFTILNSMHDVSYIYIKVVF